MKGYSKDRLYSALFVLILLSQHPYVTSGDSGQREDSTGEVFLPRTPKLPRGGSVSIHIPGDTSTVSCSGGDTTGTESLTCSRPSDAGISIDHGWGVTSRPDLFDTSCDIDVIDYSDLTPQLFRERYFFHKPLLIRNVYPEEQAPETWSRSFFAHNITGDAAVTTGQEHNTHKFNTHRRVDIQDFLEASRRHQGGLSAGVPEYIVDYIFDHEGVGSAKGDGSEDVGVFERHPSLLERVDLPREFLGRQLYSRTYLHLGQDLSGLDFHHRPDSFNVLIHGARRWYFYAPLTDIPRGYLLEREAAAQHGRRNMMLELVDSNFDDHPQSQQPYGCLQQAGDIVYIPDEWHQGTVNLGEAIGFAQESQGWQDGTVAGAVYTWYIVRQLLRGRRYEMAMVELERLITLYPKKLVFRFVYAIVAVLMERPISRDAFFRHAWSQLMLCYKAQRDTIYVKALLWLYLAPFEQKADILKWARVKTLLELDYDEV